MDTTQGGRSSRRPSCAAKMVRQVKEESCTEADQLCERWPQDRVTDFSPPSRSPTAMAGIVKMVTLPREPSADDSTAIASLEGASTMLTKSYGPSVAYCATTRQPYSSSSSFTA